MKYFCVSDVHGFYDELISALNAQGFDRNNPNHALVVCGDVFDRGSQPREMFNFLSSLDPDRFVFIRGNHEDLLFDCVSELKARGQCDNHHFSNGTVRTLTDLADIGPYDFIMPSGINAMVAAASPVMEWINRVSVNYFEVGDYIFVHGWVPIKRKYPKMSAWSISYTTADYEVVPDWRNASDADWAKARWENGMGLWYGDLVVSGKTIVCGHWHTSFGHATIAEEYPKEFPGKGSPIIPKLFRPFVREGIIAIDGCTAYTGIVNCVVLEVE